MQKITPFLWFDHQAEDAVNFYVSIFQNAKILKTTRYTEAGREVHGREPGSVMTIEFELEDQRFSAINGGPGVFEFSGAISFMIHCKTQADVDRYWEALTAGGDETAQQCGWVKDKFGVTWQVVPDGLDELLGSEDKEKSARAMSAMLQMKKIDINIIRKAFEGGS